MKFMSRNEIKEKCIEQYGKQKNRWKNNFHFDAPFGLINDPNGLSYYNGEYYIFFQWNPYGCEHKYKHWGVTKTKDFKSFKVPNVALIPNNIYDKDGCYSGSGIVKNGNLELFYTGNVKDENNNRESYQCKAVMKNDGSIEKLGPVIHKIPNGYTAHFRDPYVFEKNGKYYMILGIQTKDLKGKIVIYTSDDTQNWNFEGEVKTKFNDFGFMWECPALFDLNDKDVLVISPQGLKEEEFKYQNIYQSGYIIGKFNYDNLSFLGDDFYELDKGFDFYAPQVFKDDRGRTILIGWMGLPEKEKFHSSCDEGWVFSLTMPRELTIKNNRLYQNPLSEIRELRLDNILNLKNKRLDNFMFSDIKENSYELYLEIEKLKSNNIELNITLGVNEYFTIKYDFKNNECILDRNNMFLGEKGLRKFKLENNNIFKLNMFVDKSAIEMFFDDGKFVASTKIYPKENESKIEIKSEKDNINIKELKIWNMRGVEYFE